MDKKTSQVGRRLVRSHPDLASRYSVWSTRRPHKLKENLLGHILIWQAGIQYDRQEDLTSRKKTC